QPCGNGETGQIFSGISIADRNGDGRGDVVAVWSDKSPDAPAPAWVHQGYTTIVTAYGTDTGLSQPTKNCIADSPAPYDRRLDLALRVSDTNGDGLSDLVLAHNGRVDNTRGERYGRDGRVYLGTTGSTQALQAYVQDPGEQPYPNKPLAANFPIPAPGMGN